MNSKFKIVFAFFVIFAVTFLITDIIHGNIITHLDEILEMTNITDSENQSESAYRVSVFNGKLAVFDGNSKLPYKVYDTYIDSLPEEDKVILEQGIHVNSSSELMKIIEEYTS